MIHKRKIVLPLLVLAAGLAAAVVIVKARPEAERQQPEAMLPVVRVVEVAPTTLTLSVVSQGTVRPRTESTLVAQVSGEIRSVGRSFAEGGFFERGDLLVTIDPSDYELAVARSEAELARAELRLEQEEAQAAVAREEWDELGSGEPSPLTLREPQLAEAKAGVRSAESSLAQAELDLHRTTIRAPFAGRVRSKRADVGQFVTPGTPLADVFSVDSAEVRLPIPQDQLAFLDVPLDGRPTESGAEVLLSANLGGGPARWHARVVRTAGELDPRSRMYTLIAEVDDPYRRQGPGPILPVGLFVDAEIAGRTVEGVFVIPRAALRDRSRVLILEDETRLRFRPVELLRVEGDEIVVSSGLEAGDRVCVSTLTIVVDGMRVEAVLEGNSLVSGS